MMFLRANGTTCCQHSNLEIKCEHHVSSLPKDAELLALPQFNRTSSNSGRHTCKV